MEETRILRKRSKYLFGLCCILGICAIVTGAMAIHGKSLGDAVATLFLISTATLAFIEHRVTELKAELIEKFSGQNTKK